MSDHQKKHPVNEQSYHRDEIFWFRISNGALEVTAVGCPLFPQAKITSIKFLPDQ